MAFNEAIENLMLIKAKVSQICRNGYKKAMIDYFRKTSSIGRKEIPFSYFNSNNETELEKK